jgi:glucose-1-phosphate thymidylyltransferase
MKGIILAGGTGSRLWPSTISVSKQLIPIYDKPLIYYPLSTLMQTGIREVLVITTPDDQANFTKLLGDGGHLGMKISYAAQLKPEGLAQAFLIGEAFISQGDVALILGDNIFHGPIFESKQTIDSRISGALIYGYEVKDPGRYGVAEVNEIGEVLSIEEKPLNPRSSLAIPGLYFFDETVVSRAQVVVPSSRGELEITSVLESYMEEAKLKLNVLPRGTTWMDCGTVDSLNDACNYVRVIEERQSFKIAAVEEIAWNNKWISDEEFFTAASKLGNNEYSRYLLNLFDKQVMG